LCECRKVLNDASVVTWAQCAHFYPSIPMVMDKCRGRACKCLLVSFCTWRASCWSSCDNLH